MKEMEFNNLRINESKNGKESVNIEAKTAGDYCYIENNTSSGCTTVLAKRENHNYLDLQRSYDNVPKSSYDNAPIPKSRNVNVHELELSNDNVHVPKLSNDNKQEHELKNDNVHEPELSNDSVHVPKLSNDNVHVPKLSNDNAPVPKLSNGSVQVPTLSNNNVHVPQCRRTFTTSVKQHMDCIVFGLIVVLFAAVIALAVVLAMLKVADQRNQREKGPDVVFSVYTAIPDTGNGTALQFWHEMYNIGNLFNISTGEFVCKQAGLYLFILSIIPDTKNGTEDASCYFYKNDVKSGLATWYANVNNQTIDLPVGTISQRLLPGDVFYIKDCTTSHQLAFVSTFTGFLVFADD